MLIAKENVMGMGFRASADRDRKAFEGFADPIGVPAEADLAFGTDFSGGIVWAVLDGGKGLRQIDWAGLVAAGRRVHIQGLVRASSVMAGSPVGHPGLGLVVVRKALKAQQLSLQAAIKALIFAFALRVARPGVADPDPQVHQPGGQAGIMR